MMRVKIVFRDKGISTAFVLLAALPALAGPTPAVKCEASKNKAAGAYYLCREKAEATAITKALPADYSKCTAKFDDKWVGAETTGAGACPDTVLTAPMNAFIAAQAADVALVVAGAPIPDCAGDLATCDGELSTCDGELATCLGDCVASVRPPLRTGQTICYNTAGSVIACAGTGHDGDWQKGAARSFTDNGDGTVTDHTTGLMWEKQSDDDSIHDKDNAYTWDNAFASKVATLNSTVFAGHNDWRVPNRFELDTLVNLAAENPATYPAFNTACAATCTVLTCSCSPFSQSYWSSSTFQGDRARAWLVNLNSGFTNYDYKTLSRGVRAVRAGS